MRSLYKFMVPVLLGAVLIGCKKDYLETGPSNAVSPEVIFQNTDGAYVALDGAYRWMYEYMGSHGNFGQKSYDIVNDLMGNDMVVHTAGYGWFNTDYRLTSQATAASGGRSERTWWYYYVAVNNANNILANIDGAAGPQADRDNIKGQALAIRAYAYYNLINWFQHTYKGNENKPGVPLITAPSVTSIGRGTVQDVYDQIIEDLTDAEELLTSSRRHISHINKNVAQGLRARVALQMEDWSTAATYANRARQGHSPMTPAQYLAGFSKVTDGNPEWMWGMEVITDQSTIYASFFSHIDITNMGYAGLGTQKKITKALYDQIPAGDIRKDVFTAPGTGACSASNPDPDYNQWKFRVATPGSWAADYIFMRAAEMYLIEAEALARQGGQDGPARNVLEALIQARNSAYSAASLSGSDLVDEILLQRRIELWGEGFSYFDLKRLKLGINRATGTGNHGGANGMTGGCAGNNLDAVVYTLPAEDNRFLLRIPQSEIDANESITAADQNP